jgi:hypothetical protein
MKRVTTGIVAVGALAFGCSPARADAPPAIAAPGCVGLIVADANHIASVDGASGNPRASVGPGYFFGPDTAEAVHAVQDACS